VMPEAWVLALQKLINCVEQMYRDCIEANDDRDDDSDGKDSSNPLQIAIKEALRDFMAVLSAAGTPEDNAAVREAALRTAMVLLNLTPSRKMSLEGLCKQVRDWQRYIFMKITLENLETCVKELAREYGLTIPEQNRITYEYNEMMEGSIWKYVPRIKDVLRDMRGVSVCDHCTHSCDTSKTTLWCRYCIATPVCRECAGDTGYPFTACEVHAPDTGNDL